MGGKSSSITVGYRYFMGLQIGVCHEPDALLEIIAGDRTAWTGNVSSNSTVRIYAPNLFGGDEKEGGLVGELDVMLGAPDQAPNDYLAAQQGTPQPGYRGFLSLVYRGQVAVLNPYIKAWAIRVRSILKGWENNAVWLPEKAPIPCGTFSRMLVYFALDCSGSMATVTSNGKTRLANMKTAVNGALDYLDNSGVAEGAAVDVMVVGWNNAPDGRTSITRRNCSSSDIGDVKAWVNGLAAPAAAETFFPAGLMDMATFFSGGLGLPVAFFVTDGEPSNPGYTSQQIADQAKGIVDALPYPIPIPVYGFNIDLADTTWTNYVDNTTDGATVVAGGNPDAFTGKLVALLGTRFGMNPVHIVYQALTNSDWGMGYPTATIDADSFAACANALYDEGLALCMNWNNQTSIQEFTQIVADHASLVYGQDRRTGLFRMLLLRDNYNEAELPVFTKDDVRVLSYQRPSLVDTVNEIIIQYTDVVTGKDATTSPLQNLGNIQGQGRVVSQRLAFPGIPTHSLAVRVGMRELQARSTPLWKMQLEFKRGRASSMLPAEPFILDFLDTELGVRLIMRTGEMDYGNTADSVIRAPAVEDVFGMPDSGYVANPGSGGQLPDTRPVVVVTRAFELPYVEVVRQLSDSDVALLTSDVGFVGVLALKPPQGLVQNYGLYTRIDPDAFTLAANGDFTPSVLLSAELLPGVTVASYDTATASMPTSMAIGSGAWLGEHPDAELVRIDAIDTAAGTITLGRGCGDTVPQRWDAATRLWGYEDFSGVDPKKYTDGDTVDTKAAARAPDGELPLAAAPIVSVTMAGRLGRPYPPGHVLVATEAYPEAVDGEFSVTWANRNRVTQDDVLMDTTEGSVTPVDNTRYGLRFLDASDTLLIEKTDIFPATATVVLAYEGDVTMELYTIDESGESWQRHRITFAYTPPDGVVVSTITATAYTPVYDGIIVDGGA